ncbi:helix-turn-helix domain-containing protein [Providencia rettgeri]
MRLNKKIGLYIRYVRKSQGISAAKLAQLIFISQQQVSRYERGINTISLEVVFNILNILNIPIDDFVEKIIKPEQEALYNKMIVELEREGIISSTVSSDTCSIKSINKPCK